MTNTNLVDAQQEISQSEKDELTVKERGLVSPLFWTGSDGLQKQFTNPQILAHDFGVRKKKIVLSLDKGMGKTVTYLAVANTLGAEYIIILCTKNAMSAQRREILRHFPNWVDRFVYVQGSAAERAAIWKNPRYRIFITTPTTFLADAGVRAKSSGENVLPKWALNADMFMGDEFHRFLRQRTSKLFDFIRKPNFNPEHIILSSGSAMSKGPFQLWPALHFIDRRYWSSFWNYVETYHSVFDFPGRGKQIGNPINIPGFRQNISPYLFHRRKDIRDYPPKIRDFLDVQMEPWMKKIHDTLKNQLYADLDNDEMIVAKNSLDATFKIRLFMICPKTLDKSLPYGPGLEAIWEDMQDTERTHFVISTPFKAPIEHIESFFVEKKVKVFRLTGDENLSPDQLDARIAQWTKEGGVIVQTIQYATSYELLKADDMYFLGYLYDPEDNMQAEDRIHRESSDKQVPKNYRYVRHLGSYEENIVEAIMQSASNIRALLVNPLQFFRQYRA